MTMPSEITVKFVEEYNTFVLIEGQPIDSDMNRVFEALSRILYPVKYNETDAVHKLIGIIQDDEPYTTKHGTSFPRPKRPKIFDETIDSSLPLTIATLRTDWTVYNTAKRKSRLFVLKVFDHVWLLEISKGLLTYFSDVLSRTMLDNIQEICLGNHKIDILVLQDKM